MKREVVAAGRTVDEAVESGCAMLGKNRDEVKFEVLELPAKRILGILGRTSAKVRVTYTEKPKEIAVAYLTEILSRMGVGDIRLEAADTGNGLVMNLIGGDVGAVIGRRGETLDALQYLVSLAANRSQSEFLRITLDSGGYREKRSRTLEALAHRIAASAVRSRRTQTLEPMNPYERRIIHSAVQKVRGAASWSIGEEPNRRVVVGPAEKAPRPAES